MRKLASGLLAATLAATFAIGSAAPLNAAPIFVPKAPQASSDVENVQYRKWPRRHRVDRRLDRRFDRMERRQAFRDERRDFRRRGNSYYFNGYRGYRNHRYGYHEYNGWWFPAAAFAAGALITGAINNAPRYGSDAHVQWCVDRYRSYRVSDNTFQPLSGPRRQCVSPYS